MGSKVLNPNRIPVTTSSVYSLSSSRLSHLRYCLDFTCTWAVVRWMVLLVSSGNQYSGQRTLSASTMAERTSTRAGSRRTTPQPASQTTPVGTQSSPKRTIRTTRSQSRDISGSEDGRTGLKALRGAKQATPDTTSGAVGQSGSKGRKRGPASHAQIQQGMKSHTTAWNFDPCGPGIVYGRMICFIHKSRQSACTCAT